MSQSRVRTASSTAPYSRDRARTAPPLGLVDLTMLAVVLIWGLNFVLTKYTMQEMQPLVFNGFRFVLASLFLCGLVLLREKSLRVGREDWGRLIILGVVGGMLHQIFWIKGLELTKAGNSSLLISTNPIFIALLAAFLRLERVTARMWAGILLSFGGIALIVINSSQELGMGRSTSLGDGLTLLSAICWAAYAVLARPLLNRYSPLKLIALAATAGTPFLLLAAIPEFQVQDWAAISWRGWIGLAASTVFSLSLAYLLYFHAVRLMGNARTAVYDNLVPVVAILGAAIVLGEAIGPLQIAGAAVILVGTYLARAGGQR